MDKKVIMPTRSLSAKLSLGILFLAVPIFLLALGILYVESRNYVKKEAVAHANSVLNSTLQRVNRYMTTVRTATDINAWKATDNLHPDSLMAYSRFVVQLNGHTDGCSISTEPNIFPKYGRYFSVYTVRESEAANRQARQGNDSITTVIEENYEYFDKVWYKRAKERGEACWTVFFDESDTLSLTINGMVASYSKPLFTADSTFVGVISTDLSLFHLSRIISAEKPWQNSYFMMTGDGGRYLIHPDSTRLFYQTIFNDADPRKHQDIIALGHEMTEGNKGHMRVNIDDIPCLVCYQPVPNTDWSLVLVCPDSDILKSYHRLATIITILIIPGLLVILLLCHRTVSQAISPIGTLVEKTQAIASGNYEVYIPHSKRIDAVGRLQNSFAAMLESLNFHMGSIRYATEQTEQRNDELAHATQLAEDSIKQKTIFIQNMTHQIRTPLNIIMGFSQVLRDDYEQLQETELNTITDMMKHNAQVLNRMVLMLFDSSDTGITKELHSHKQAQVACNDIARECISYTFSLFPKLPISFTTDVPDDFCIHTNHAYLMLSLRELLYNAAKYSDKLNVTLHIGLTPTTVRFICKDTGPGIPEKDRERMFDFFAKINDLSEGLGLGLPLAKRHARSLGGDLTLDNDYQDGCCFILELPLRA